MWCEFVCVCVGKLVWMKERLCTVRFFLEGIFLNGGWWVFLCRKKGDFGVVGKV